MAEPSGSPRGSTWNRLRQRKVVQWGVGCLAVVGVPVTIKLTWFHGDRGHQRVARAELAILAVLLAAGGMVARPRDAALADPDKRSRDWRLAFAKLADGKSGEASSLLRRSLGGSLADADAMGPGDPLADQKACAATRWPLRFAGTRAFGRSCRISVRT